MDYSIYPGTEIDLGPYTADQLLTILNKGWSGNLHLLTPVYMFYEAEDKHYSYKKIMLSDNTKDLLNLTELKAIDGPIGHSLMHKNTLANILAEMGVSDDDINNALKEGAIQCALHILKGQKFDSEALDTLYIQHKLGL